MTRSELAIVVACLDVIDGVSCVVVSVGMNIPFITRSHTNLFVPADINIVLKLSKNCQPDVLLSG